jgi:hypothetical protein
MGDFDYYISGYSTSEEDDVQVLTKEEKEQLKKLREKQKQSEKKERSVPKKDQNEPKKSSKPKIRSNNTLKSELKASQDSKPTETEKQYALLDKAEKKVAKESPNQANDRGGAFKDAEVKSLLFLIYKGLFFVDFSEFVVICFFFGV